MRLENKGHYETSQIGRFRSVETQKLYERVEATKAKFSELTETFVASDGQDGDKNVLSGQILLTGRLSGFYDSKSGELEATKHSGGELPGGGMSFGTESFSFSSTDRESVWRTEKHYTDSRGKRTEVLEILEDLSTGLITVLESD